MRFPFSFERTIGGAGTALGADVAPVDSTYLVHDNVYVTEIPADQFVSNAAISYKYDGVGPAPSLTASIYVYDGTSAKWFMVNTVAFGLENNDIKFEPIPNLIGALRTTAVDANSTSSSLEFALVVAAAGGEPNGTYTFYMGIDINPSAELATEATLAAISGKLSSPMPVVGSDLDGAVATFPPVLVGGVHRADPSADPVDDGNVGVILINDQRMPVVEDRAYDPVSDADKVIPVWSPPDGWVPEDLSSSLGADGTVTKYIVGLPWTRFSLQFIPAPAAAETIALTIAVSNEDTGDVATQTYTDITNKLVGAASITTEDVINPEFPVRALTWRFTFTVTGWTAGVSAWDAFLVKGEV
jgi:hypothetical protein